MFETKEWRILTCDAVYFGTIVRTPQTERFSKRVVNFYQTIRYRITKDSIFIVAIPLCFIIIQKFIQSIIQHVSVINIKNLATCFGSMNRNMSPRF
jgi:hypothetical protein